MRAILISFFLLAACQSTRLSDSPSLALQDTGLPADALVLPSSAFTIVYNPKENIAYYADYTLRAETLSRPRVKRRDRFHADARLKELGQPAVEPEWYAKSGFDRGHLAPAADFAWDEKVSDETFVMSNMVPQRPKLNRIAWNALERVVRRWACHEKEVRVVTGPILETGAATLPGHPVPIPKRFFKVVFDETPPKKVIAFILTQEDKTAGAYKTRVVSLGQVESETQLRFRSRQIASDPDISQWKEASCGD